MGTEFRPIESSAADSFSYYGDRDYTPHHHRDGGYALRHEWM